MFGKPIAMQLDRETILGMTAEENLQNLHVQFALTGIANPLSLIDSDNPDWEPVRFPPIDKPKTPLEVLNDLLGYSEEITQLMSRGKNDISLAIEKLKSGAYVASSTRFVNFYIQILISACENGLIPQNLGIGFLEAIIKQNQAQVYEYLLSIFTLLGFDTKAINLSIGAITKRLVATNVGGSDLCEVLQSLI